jgi:hypothetical protein
MAPCVIRSSAIQTVANHCNKSEPREIASNCTQSKPGGLIQKQETGVTPVPAETLTFQL